MFSDNSPGRKRIHETVIFDANGNELNIIEQEGGVNTGTQCNGVYTLAMAQAHDSKVRDFVDSRFGPLDNPCSNDTTCEQQCINVRGNKRCACVTGYSVTAEGQCLQGVALINKGRCGREGNVFSQTGDCDTARAQAPALFSFVREDGQAGYTGLLKVGDLCLTTDLSEGQATRTKQLASTECTGGANQMWQCLGNGRIEQPGTGLYLKSGFQQCSPSANPTQCKAEDLDWRAFGDSACSFCANFVGDCNNGLITGTEEAPHTISALVLLPLSVIGMLVLVFVFRGTFIGLFSRLPFWDRLDSKVTIAFSAVFFILATASCSLSNWVDGPLGGAGIWTACGEKLHLPVIANDDECIDLVDITSEGLAINLLITVRFCMVTAVLCAFAAVVLAVVIHLEFGITCATAQLKEKCLFGLEAASFVLIWIAMCLYFAYSNDNHSPVFRDLSFGPGGAVMLTTFFVSVFTCIVSSKAAYAASPAKTTKPDQSKFQKSPKGPAAAI